MLKGSSPARRWWLLAAANLFPLFVAWPALAGPPSPEDQEIETRRTTYEALCAYQKTAEFTLNWPLQHTLDLNGDGVKESFLLFSEHAHFGTYSIFTSKDGKWVYLGQCSWGTCQPNLRRGQHRGWKDFAVNIHSSRNMIAQDHYSWNPKTNLYDEHGWKVVRESDGD